jgi:hypothetical protein
MMDKLKSSLAIIMKSRLYNIFLMILLLTLISFCFLQVRDAMKLLFQNF